MSDIQVSPARLHSEHARLNSQSHDLGEVALHVINQAYGTSWQGNSHESFLKLCANMNTFSREIVNAIEQASSYLEEAAQMYTETERKTTSTFQTSR